MLVSQVLAIVWLWRSFPRANLLNILIGAVSIGMSALMLLLVGLFILVHLIPTLALSGF